VPVAGDHVELSDHGATSHSTVGSAPSLVDRSFNADGSQAQGLIFLTPPMGERESGHWITLYTDKKNFPASMWRSYTISVSTSGEDAGRPQSGRNSTRSRDAMQVSWSCVAYRQAPVGVADYSTDRDMWTGLSARGTLGRGRSALSADRGDNLVWGAIVEEREASHLRPAAEHGRVTVGRSLQGRLTFRGHTARPRRLEAAGA